MAKQHYLPKSDMGKQQWLINFSSKLQGYAAKYNLTVAQVADMVACALHFSYWFNYRSQYADYLKKLTEYKNESRDGVAAGAVASVPPEPPVLGAAPPSVDPGIFVRAAAIANGIKKSKDYTVADGNDLAIEGTEHVQDLPNAKPVITVRLVDGGKPEIQWVKGDMDGIDIYVDRGDGKFIFLATDTFPDYIDTTPLAAGTTAVWKYQAIYRFGDDQTGQWSDIVPITVAGR